MSVFIAGWRSEPGRLLSLHKATGRVHIDVAGQQANKLLHGGHAWKNFARTALAGTRGTLRFETGARQHAD